MSVFVYSNTCPKFPSTYKKVFKSEVLDPSFSSHILPWAEVGEMEEPPFMVVYMDTHPAMNFSFRTKGGFLTGNAHVIYDHRTIHRYKLNVCDAPLGDSQEGGQE